MPDASATVTLLERREIEARIVGPLVRGFIEEIGRERALEVVGRVVRELAREAGEDLARRTGEATLPAFAQCLDRWREGGALEIEMLAETDERLDFNVTRCRFAEMYRALGLADLGASLSCVRDFALVEGFSSEITLERTQTIMQGASHCDFRFRRRPKAASDDEE
jgi:predicted hydrocarbon binding protein